MSAETDKEMEIKIGKVLSKIIKEKQLTIKAVSRLSGVPASTIGEWLNGRTPKNPVDLKRVSDALDVSLHYLLFGIEDERQTLTLDKILKEDVFDGSFQITIKRLKIGKN